MAGPPSSWSAQQLAEFLAAVSAADDSCDARRLGVEHAAETLDAEVAAVLDGDAVAVSIGFPSSGAPEAELVAAARTSDRIAALPGLGLCSVAAARVSDSERLVVARQGTAGFPGEEIQLLRGMARVLSLSLESLKLLERERQAQKRLAASERQTRQILETAHDAFVSIDDRGSITDWNPQAEATFGWSREEALGRELAETIIPERYRAAHRRGLERFLTTREGPVLGRRLELSALHRDGHEFPVELTISPLQFEDGCSFNAFLRDISERKAAEELVERQRVQLVEAQSVGGFGSWEWDVVADALECSDELCRIYGLDPGNRPVTFEDFVQHAHPDDRERMEATAQAAYSTGEPFSLEHRVVRPDGAVRVVHGRGEVITDHDGTPLKVLATAQDITERREVERAKEEFTSVVSHELRTPLTSIRGSLGLLESGALGALPEKGRRMIEIAVQNTDRLVRLISDILDVERLDSGKVEMHQEPCEARELVERAAEVMAPMAGEANVRLSVETEPVSLFADPDRILQTLTNLISNAIKFSPPGSAVRVSARPRDGGALFQVSDAGRGIPAESLETVFERFQQVDASDSREKGGTGLGLAICRTIVDHHGGRIWADSALGEGSTFSFVLPAEGADVLPDAAQTNREGPAAPLWEGDASAAELVGQRSSGAPAG